jgi:hypothetical protein
VETSEDEVIGADDDEDKTGCLIDDKLDDNVVVWDDVTCDGGLLDVDSLDNDEDEVVGAFDCDTDENDGKSVTASGMVSTHFPL